MMKKEYSKIYRIMHWAIALCMVLLLITIFLRMTWLNKINVAAIIEAYLHTINQTITDKEAIVLAKQIRHPMWMWHIYIGYALVGLFSLRFLLPVFGKMKFQNPLKAGLTRKQRFQYWMYLVFYACVATSLITGLFMEFGPADLEHTMEDIHVLSIYYLVAYMIIHIGGVLAAEFSDEQGLISRIISGVKK